MRPSGTIEVNHLWKRFRADRRRRKMRDEVARARARLRGQTDLGWRWALRDVELKVAPGESVGLIGTNGSGKSTLLKLISRVMYPYAGGVEVEGRVGALIEVSSGIHPELTGRENTFLFGSLLGLPRRKVAERFDEIVSFAELESAIDRQVKFYSSGMKMRLGFAVAAFLEPEVLLVDEVLAVGDASFQQKCLDRMRAVLAQGTTLVFVSHDLAAVEATCTRGLWLETGIVQADAPIAEALGCYRRAIEETAESGPALDGLVKVLKVEIKGDTSGPPKSHGSLNLRLVLATEAARGGNLYLGVSEGPATPIFSLSRDVYLSPGETDVRITVRRLPLPRGRYYLWIGMFQKQRDLLAWHPAAHFDVDGPLLDPAPRGIVRLAPVYVDTGWELEHR